MSGDTAIERSVQIVNRLGMHARPAAEFVKLASRFRADVRVEKEGLEVDGKSIMGVLMLAAEQGSQLTIRAAGHDAEAALAALCELVDGGFHEAYEEY
jgi:phosphocarrier protein